MKVSSTPFLPAKLASWIVTFMRSVSPKIMFMIAAIPPKHSVAWFVKTLKGSSAYFINTALWSSRFHFAWQRGYGSLTIGELQKEMAIAYVNLQKDHHRNGTTIAWLERCQEEEPNSAD